MFRLSSPYRPYVRRDATRRLSIEDIIQVSLERVHLVPKASRRSKRQSRKSSLKIAIYQNSFSLHWPLLEVPAVVRARIERSPFPLRWLERERAGRAGRAGRAKRAKRADRAIASRDPREHHVKIVDPIRGAVHRRGND